MYADEQTLAATAPCLRAIQEKFAREVDPAGLLSPSERAKRAENLRKAHLAPIRLKASRQTQRRREAAAVLAARNGGGANAEAIRQDGGDAHGTA
jgi:hypothetical protein